MSDMYFVSDEYALLRILQQQGSIMAMCHSVLSPEHFSKRVHQWIYRYMHSFFEKYKKSSPRRYLIKSLKVAVGAGEVRVEEAKLYSHKIIHLKDGVKSPDSIQDEVSIFIKRQMYEAAAKKLFTTLTEGKPEDVFELDNIFTKCRYAGEINKGEAHFLKADFDKAINHKIEQTKTGKVYHAGTGVPQIDCILDNGGVGPGELGMFLAPYSRGKSFALAQVAMEAARRRRNVAYFTLEMSKDKVNDRLISATTGGLTQNLRVHNILNYEKRFRNRFNNVVHKFKFGEVHIKSYPTRGASPGTLLSYLQRLRETSGWYPDVVVVDYGDILKPSRYSATDLHREQGSIFEDLRGIAGELSVPLWTATQGNRDSIKKKTIHGDSIAESIIKANIADIIISLNQDADEYDSNVLRMYIDKSRDQKKNFSFAIRTGYAWGRLYLGPALDDAQEHEEFENAVNPFNDDIGSRQPADWLPSDILRRAFNL